ncbi:MAG: PPC domain-containing protein [Planctomycetaceae bacterium]
MNNALGGTGSRPFIVGDLPELVETESNSTVEHAEPTTLPVTLNGRIHGERDADYFRFKLNAGESVVCEVMAGRIGSPLDPLVELQDGDGVPLVTRQVHIGSDPVLLFSAEDDGEYLLRVTNVTFHGSPAHVYRINLTKQPHIQFAFPTGGQAGTTQDVELHLLSGTKTQVVSRAIEFPERHGEFLYHDSELKNSVLLIADTSPNSVEREPNDDLKTATEIALPQTVSGRFLTEADEDWFRFGAKKEQILQITCRAFPPGTSAMPNIAITDHDGNLLVETRSVTSTAGVCRILWTAPQSGIFHVKASDLRQGSRGGPDFLYRLSVVPAKPDFVLTLASDNIGVVQGAKSQVDVSVERFGGFSGAIDLSLEGLPPGCTVSDHQVPAGAGSFKLEIAATEDVPVSSTQVRLIGRAECDGCTLERTGQGRHLGVDSEGVSVGRPSPEQLHLTVLHKPLFQLACSEAYHYAHRGTVFPYAMEVERLHGFDGEIIVQRGDRQNRDMDGVEIWNAVIPPGSSKVDVPIYLPESMHINVQSQSQLYSQAFARFQDSHGREQSMLLVAAKRNMMRTLPPVVKLQAVDREVLAQPGGTVRCGLHLERTSNYPGPMNVTLLEPKGDFLAEPLEIPGGESDVQLTVHVPMDLEPGTEFPLVFRGQGQLDDRIKVITEASVVVQVN